MGVPLMKLGTIVAFALAMCLVALATVPAQSSATYPGADGRIVFAQQMEQPLAAKYDLVSVLPDGTAPIQLTDLPGIETSADWSADGERIVFTHGYRRSRIYVMRADGSEQTAVSEPRVLDYDWHLVEPTFTPSGDRIVFSTKRSIWSVRTDGTESRRALSISREAHRPTLLCHGSGRFAGRQTNRVRARRTPPEG
jgi:dipeptidyl aminopeptidase/acylaminoacyl peptidase